MSDAEAIITLADAPRPPPAAASGADRAGAPAAAAPAAAPRPAPAAPPARPARRAPAARYRALQLSQLLPRLGRRRRGPAAGAPAPAAQPQPQPQPRAARDVEAANDDEGTDAGAWSGAEWAAAATAAAAPPRVPAAHAGARPAAVAAV